MRTQEVKERVADAKRQLADILKDGGATHVTEGAKGGFEEA